MAQTTSFTNIAAYKWLDPKKAPKYGGYDEGQIASWRSRAAAGSSAAQKNLRYYTSGTGYREAITDWAIQETEKIAPGLGLKATQLLTNPQLYKDPVALKKYTTVQPEAKPSAGVKPSIGAKPSISSGPLASLAGAGATGTSYEVKSGDTLSEIAARYGVRVGDISGYRSGDPNLIYPGEKLTIGVGGVPGAGPTGAVGSIGTWYDLATGQGYSGPKKDASHVAADPTTGQPMGGGVPPAGGGVPPPGGGGVGVTTGGAGVGDGAGVGLGAGVGEGVTDAKQDLIDRLVKALDAEAGRKTPEEQWTALREERGMPGMEEVIGTFEEEIDKTRDLLSDLTARIRGGQAREAARLAPMELVTGRQAEIKTQAGLQEATLQSTLETLARGHERAEKRYGREETDILNLLGLRAQEEGRPLERLGTELGMRADIESLFAEGKIDTQVVEVGGRKLLIDKQTGKTLQDLGAAEGAGAGAKSEVYGNYTTRLNQEINNLYSGRYGEEGAREKVLEILKREFPEVDVSTDVYSKIPDGYEKDIKGAKGEQFITKDYIREKLASRIGVSKVLKASGVANWKPGTQPEEVQAVIDKLMIYADGYRTAGYTDEEAWEAVLEKLNGWEK